MANTFTPTDIYKNINKIIDQQSGDSVSPTATSGMVSVGQAAQIYGYENTLNKLSAAMGRVLTAVRPYKGGFSLVESSNEEYGQIARKISYFYDGYEASENYNTNLSDTQLKDGSSVDMYKIRKRYPLEIQFGGVKVLEKSWTRFLNQLKISFSSASQFDAFYRGEATQMANEIQMMKEAENRALVLNAIGATYQTGGDKQKINMVKEFNASHGTTYTTAELLGSHLKEFMQFFVSLIRFYSDLLETNCDMFHLTPVKTNDAGETLRLLRHTPKNCQRLLLSSQIWHQAEASVMSEVFNDQYLKLDQAEKIPFWQSPMSPNEVNVVPNILDTTTGLSKDGEATSIAVVLGLLYDKDALSVTYRQEDVLTTPVNAKGVYYNTVHHWAKDYRYDATENMILFYMKDDEV